MKTQEVTQPATQPAAPVTVRISATAADWHKLATLRANATAAKKLADAHEELMGIPSAEDIAKLANLPDAHGKLSAIVCDGNGQPIGKLAVYWFPGAEMPEGYRRRIS